MKIGTIVIIAIVLTVIFGAVPLQFIGTAFEWLGGILKSIGKALDFFGWGGVLTIQNLNQGGFIKI